jgi:hypothetical protein
LHSPLAGIMAAKVDDTDELQHHFLEMEGCCDQCNEIVATAEKAGKKSYGCPESELASCTNFCNHLNR